MIDDQYIINYFFKPGFFNAHQYKRMTDDIKEYLEKKYSDSLSLKETIYRIKEGIETHPVCPVCGKLLPFYGKSGKVFLDHCSVKCSSLDKEVQAKLHKTKLEKYGDPNYLNKEKSKQTCLKKYGVEHYTNRKKSEQTKLERYSNKYFNNIEKSQQTKIERYGDKGYNNKEKAKQTCLEKYGVTSPLKLKEIQDKIKQTCIEKYGVTNGGGSAIALKHMKETWERNYHTDNPMKVKKIKNKSKQTCLEKYGVEYVFQLEEVKNKAKETMLKKYGEEHHMRNKQIKEKFNWKERNFKREETLRKNNSFNKSEPEDKSYILLKEKYPDIIRQYKSELYPFNCDFYIPSLNLYIECNYFWTHGFHAYDINNKKDKKRVNELIKLDKNCDATKNGKKSLYKHAIYVWTDLDIRKRNIAKENNLNFIEFFNIDELKEWLFNN